MFGSNYYGKAYYGQGPAEGTTFTLHSVSATIVALASISTKLLINQAVSASVTVTATLTRQVNRTLSATVTLLATISSTLVEGLNIRNAATKLLNLYRTTNPLDEKRTTKQLNLVKTTRLITTNE